MMALQGRFFLQQTWALTKKNFLIIVVRHWSSTLSRALILPVVFMALLANIKNLAFASNGYGVGSPAPVASLADSLPVGQKLVFVLQPGLGADVARVVKTLSAPVANKTLVFLSDQNNLITTCKESLRGRSDCFAAVVFNDSPLTTGAGKRGVWNYTIRTDSGLNGATWSSNSHMNDQERVYLPWQVAIDNAIANSTIVPNEYLFSSISKATHDNNVRKKYQQLIVSTYGIAFFITMISSIYHLAGMMTTERESGMAALIDTMGGSPSARICSYILAFNVIYLPSWIIIGISTTTCLSTLNCANYPSLPNRGLQTNQHRDPHLLADFHWHGHNERLRLRSYVLQPGSAIWNLQHLGIPHRRRRRSDYRPRQRLHRCGCSLVVTFPKHELYVHDWEYGPLRTSGPSHRPSDRTECST
jgi:hypothetical protein